MRSPYALNRLLFDVRHDEQLRRRLMSRFEEVADLYGLEETAKTAARTLLDVVGVEQVQPFAQPLVDAGAHPLQVLMSLHVMSHWKSEEE